MVFLSTSYLYVSFIIVHSVLGTICCVYIRNVYKMNAECCHFMCTCYLPVRILNRANNYIQMQRNANFKCWFESPALQSEGTQHSAGQPSWSPLSLCHRRLCRPVITSPEEALKRCACPRAHRQTHYATIFPASALQWFGCISPSGAWCRQGNTIRYNQAMCMHIW